MSERRTGRGATGGARKATRAGAKAAKADEAREAAATARRATKAIVPRLLAVRIAQPADDEPVARAFPFTVPAVRALASLDLSAAVTCLVGENGSGKSTLLEALAIRAALPVAGAHQSAGDDPSLAAQRALAERMTLAWAVRMRRGFFLRAEDFFAWQLSVGRERASLEARLAEIDVELADASPHARALAKGPVYASLSALAERYGDDVDAQSHGEAFLAFFQRRIVPEGLYLLDEPEAALSPQRQLALVSLVLQAVDAGSQFVIATHSPILLAIPGARVYSFDEGGAPAEVAWDETDHVRLTRDFLASPARYLDRLR